MKWQEFRRSVNVEDYTDPNRPVSNQIVPMLSINDMLQLTGSPLAHKLGVDALVQALLKKGD